MSTSAAPVSKPQSFLKTIHIPPVFYFVISIFVIGILLDQIIGSGEILRNPVILTNIFVRSVALGIVAVGQTFVIIGGSIDLSVAYVVSITSVMSSFMMQGDPAKVPAAIATVIAIGIVIGLGNGLIITKLGVNSFIATLGMALILRGVLYAAFANFVGTVPRSFETLGYGTIGPIPISIIVLLLVVVVGWLLLTRTTLGAHLYGVGGNKEVARLSGVRTDRVLIAAHIFCSVTAVLTGLFVVSRLRSGAPWVGTDGLYDLESDRHNRYRWHCPIRWKRRGVGHAWRCADLRNYRYRLQPIRRRSLSQERPKRCDYCPGSRQLYHSL